MRRYLILSLSACFPLLIQAAVNPVIVNENAATNRQACIDNHTNNCINTNCINSSSLSCTQDCQTQAQNQCAGMSE